MLIVPDVLPVHRLKELVTFDLLHTHSSNPILSISAIPETHKWNTEGFYTQLCKLTYFNISMRVNFKLKSKNASSP